MPSMGPAVKTYLHNAPAAHFSTAGVRNVWIAGSTVQGGCVRWIRIAVRKSFTAFAFSAREQEPSSYLELIGPSLRSALQECITYPWGLGPLGPAQQFNGCFPLKPVRSRFVGPVFRNAFHPTLVVPGPVYFVASSSFVGSYRSPVRQSASIIEAI